MELPRLNQSVVRVTRLDHTSAGGYTPVVLFERQPAKRKRGSRILRELERGQARAISAGRTFLDDYAHLSEESNARRKDGWLLDMGPNVLDAGMKAVKKLKVFRLPAF
jgi:hypothetical protein